jgi:hypothetical protein
MPKNLLDVNKALRSIGKGDHNVAVSKGGYTQVDPSSSTKTNAVSPAQQ